MQLYLNISLLILSVIQSGVNRQLTADYSLKVNYVVSTQRFEDSNKKHLEQAVLIASKSSSFFIWENMVILDSLKQANGELQATDVLNYRTTDPYAIITKADTVTYHEKIGKQVYVYSEKVDFDWSLHGETKKIMGYDCKMATTTYGGRQWTAWYTLDIPISAGPYKFQGLPGLILDISDKTGDYNFQAVGLQFSEIHDNIARVNYFKSMNDQPERISKTDFSKLKRKFYKMTLNERLNFLNGTSNSEMILTNPNTGERIGTNKRDVRERTFIEK